MRIGNIAKTVLRHFKKKRRHNPFVKFTWTKITICELPMRNQRPGPFVERSNTITMLYNLFDRASNEKTNPSTNLFRRNAPIFIWSIVDDIRNDSWYSHNKLTIKYTHTHIRNQSTKRIINNNKHIKNGRQWKNKFGIYLSCTRFVSALIKCT